MGLFSMPNKREPARVNTNFQEKVETEQKKEANFLFGEEKKDETQI